VALIKQVLNDVGVPGSQIGDSTLSYATYTDTHLACGRHSQDGSSYRTHVSLFESFADAAIRGENAKTVMDQLLELAQGTLTINESDDFILKRWDIDDATFRTLNDEEILEIVPISMASDITTHVKVFGANEFNTNINKSQLYEAHDEIAEDAHSYATKAFELTIDNPFLGQWGFLISELSNVTGVPSTMIVVNAAQANMSGARPVGAPPPTTTQNAFDRPSAARLTYLYVTDGTQHEVIECDDHTFTPAPNGVIVARRPLGGVNTYLPSGTVIDNASIFDISARGAKGTTQQTWLFENGTDSTSINQFTNILPRVYDITIACQIADQIVERHAHGVPRYNIYTLLTGAEFQIGDIVTFPTEKYAWIRADQLNIGTTWEIIAVEIIPTADGGRVCRLEVARLKDFLVPEASLVNDEFVVTPLPLPVSDPLILNDGTIVVNNSGVTMYKG